MTWTSHAVVPGVSETAYQVAKDLRRGVGERADRMHQEHLREMSPDGLLNPTDAMGRGRPACSAEHPIVQGTSLYAMDACDGCVIAGVSTALLDPDQVLQRPNEARTGYEMVSAIDAATEVVLRMPDSPLKVQLARMIQSAQTLRAGG